MKQQPPSQGDSSNAASAPNASNTPRQRVIAVTLTRDDFLLANAALQRLAGDPRRSALIVALAAAAGVALIGAPALMLSWPMAVTAPLACAASLALGWAAATRLMRKNLTASLRDDGAFLRPYRLTAMAEGLVIESETARTELSWRGVLGIDVTDDQILIRTDGAAAVIIPKSSFADIGAMRVFLEQIRSLRRRTLEEPWTVKSSEPSREAKR